MYVTPDPPTLPGADWAGLVDPETTNRHHSHGVTIDPDWIAVGDDRYPLHQVRRLRAVHEHRGTTERYAMLMAATVACAAAWAHDQLDTTGWTGVIAALAATLLLVAARAWQRWHRSAVIADHDDGPILIMAELPRRTADRMVAAGYLAKQAAQLP